jgi:iron complex outermembrane receptor protein
MDELLVSPQRLIFHYGELNRQLVATGNAPLIDNDPRLIRDAYTTSGFCMLFDNDPTSFEDDCATGLKSENTQFTANLAWDINENNTLKFSGGYQDVSVDQRSDWLTIGVEIRSENYQAEATMLEATLNSELFDNNLSLVTGINYYKEETEEFSHVLRNNSSNQMADTRDIYGDDFDREAIGLFGQGVWHFNDGNTNLTAGLRYTSEDISAILREWESGDFNIPSCDTASSTGGGGIVVRDPNCMVEVSGSESYSEVDWKIGLDHRFNDSMMIFATASKAYRSGAWSHNLSATVDPSNLSIAPTEPEEVINLEAGFRSDWFDNRFRLNFTYFDMDFTDRQGARLEILGDTARVVTVTLGDVEIKGWELDANLAATDNLTFFVAVGHTDAQYKTPNPPNEVLIAGVPEYSYNIGGRYEVELGGGELSFNLNYTWQDERDSTGRDPTREDSHMQASYGLLNGNIQYAFGEERNWTVSLSGQNILDDEYGLGELRFGRIFMVSPRGTPINFNQMADRGPPRMIFGSVNYAF